MSDLPFETLSEMGREHSVADVRFYTEQFTRIVQEKDREIAIRNETMAETLDAMDAVLAENIKLREMLNKSLAQSDELEDIAK